MRLKEFGPKKQEGIFCENIQIKGIWSLKTHKKT